MKLQVDDFNTVWWINYDQQLDSIHPWKLEAIKYSNIVTSVSTILFHIINTVMGAVLYQI